MSYILRLYLKKIKIKKKLRETETERIEAVIHTSRQNKSVQHGPGGRGGQQPGQEDVLLRIINPLPDL